MRYDRLSLLMDQVDGHMKAMGLFRMNSLGMVREAPGRVSVCARTGGGPQLDCVGVLFM